MIKVRCSCPQGSVTRCERLVSCQAIEFMYRWKSPGQFAHDPVAASARLAAVAAAAAASGQSYPPPPQTLQNQGAFPPSAQGYYHPASPVRRAYPHASPGSAGQGSATTREEWDASAGSGESPTSPVSAGAGAYREFCSCPSLMLPFRLVCWSLEKKIDSDPHLLSCICSVPACATSRSCCSRCERAD